MSEHEHHVTDLAGDPAAGNHVFAADATQLPDSAMQWFSRSHLSETR